MLWRSLASALPSLRRKKNTFGPSKVNAWLWTSAVLSLSASSSLSMSVVANRLRVIDSHVHVWANQHESNHGFPYAQDPPESLQNRACIESLVRALKANDIQGALIVQPINHQFDHSYVRQAITKYPQTFKGMMLHDPSLSALDAVARLEELVLAGFVGVRFNPYLWENSSIVDDDVDQESSSKRRWSPMSEGAGLAVYQRCGELRIPVGIMCFQGLSWHYDDILSLLKRSPTTTLILDHFGFTSILLPPSEDGKVQSSTNEDATTFSQLLNLAQYPQVHVKISALFRLGDTTPTYEHVYQQRFLPLLKAFGPDRLLYGSDFPFILEQAVGYTVHELVASWCPDDVSREAILGGTAERLFGPWGINSVSGP